MALLTCGIDMGDCTELQAQQETSQGGVPWTVGDILRGLVVGFVGSIVLVEMAALAARLIDHAQPKHLPAPAVFVSTLLVEALLFATAWYLSVRKYHIDWASLGFRPLRGKGDLLLVGAALFTGFTVNVIYAIIITSFGLRSLRPPPLPSFSQEEGGFVLMAILAVLVAPVAEETFFRGFLFAGLRKRLGAWPGALITAVLFSLAHFSVGVFIPVFVLGLLLAWLYTETRSLFACIAFHMIHNSLALAAGL